MQERRDGKGRLSEGQWRVILGKQQRSGLCRAAFCRREGIRETTFQYWYRKLEGLKGRMSLAGRGAVTEGLPAVMGPSGPATFVEVGGGKAGGEVMVELELPYGMRLMVRGGRC